MKTWCIVFCRGERGKLLLSIRNCALFSFCLQTMQAKSVVIRAGRDRLKRIQNELDAEQREAEFVNEMELRQIRNGIAIFAPSITTMVISAVAALSEQNREKTALEAGSDDEEDDVPLTEVAAKMQLPVVTLADVAVYISQTWGSVYIEPSHVQYAW